MKNKHLVLIFFTVLALGYATRWLPVRYRSFFESNLLLVDTATAQRITVSVPGKPDLFLERVESGWSAEQHGRTVPVSADTMSAMLDLLANLSAFQVLKTTRPDTLGLTAENALRVRVLHTNNQTEQVEIGAEGILGGNAWTYLRLPAHGGIYQVPGRLRSPLARTLDDFRSPTILPAPPEATSQIALTWPPDTTVVWEKQDSTGRWGLQNTPLSLSADSVLNWLSLFNRLNGSPFADHFDESSESETLYATIVLGNRSPQTLRFFYLKPPDAPEDLTPLRLRGIRMLPSYVVHASINPLNYFAVTDTALVQRICRGPDGQK